MPAKTDLVPSKPIIKTVKAVKPPTNALKKRLDELAIPKKPGQDRKSSGSKSRDQPKLSPIVSMKFEEL